MNKQQADFKPWDEGCIAIPTCDEWIHLKWMKIGL